MTTSSSKVTDGTALNLERDEISCPICMEHPHNAVLLVCSSYQNGCRCFVCDTSYRHSNCLDRLRNLNTESSKDRYDQSLIDVPLSQTSSHHGFGSAAHQSQGGESSVKTEEFGGTAFVSSNMQCPLCRGTVFGLRVLPETRRYLNLKLRCCSLESCSFKGNYMELRRHARQVHPAMRPADVDPSRERVWRRLELQCEHDDVLSTIRSENPGAVVLGDYVVDGEERVPYDYPRWFMHSFTFTWRNVRSPRTRSARPFGTLHANRSRHRSSPRGDSFGWRGGARGSPNQDARAPWRRRRSFARPRNEGGTRN